jgi:threonylcarbamoyladenosine tRNA methylthiotransferase MtaB
MPDKIKKIAVHTLGCKVNQFESEALVQAFQERGWDLVSFQEPADLYLINTCAVTAEAQRQSAQAVRGALRRSPEALIAAAGCAAQLFPEVFNRLTGLDYLFGTGNKLELPSTVDFSRKPACPQNRIQPVSSFNPLSLECPTPTQRTRGLFRIQEGCDAHCSYCIVPQARGPSRSLPPELVREGLLRLGAAGIREIILTGIHLGQYGRDLRPPWNLTGLLKEVLRAPALPSLRLSSLEMHEVTPELVSLIKKEPRLSSHLHIPLQSGDDPILLRMNRPYSSTEYAELLYRLRAELPYAALGADVIVGFPGEDERAFQRTHDFIARLPLAYLHVFPYSSRPGTPAALFPGQVPAREKKERARRLRALDKHKRSDFFRRCAGREFSALVLRGPGPDGWCKGLTENYLSIRLKGNFQENTRLRVRITGRDEKGVLAAAGG